MIKKTELIVALDTDRFEEAEKIVDHLSPVVDIFKVGLTAYVAFGEELLEKLHRLNKKIFLDLKFHDIPNTVYQAVKMACRKKVDFIDVHALGGEQMIRKAREAIDEQTAHMKPKLLAVTVLTSMDAQSFRDLGFQGRIREKVASFAAMAQKAGADGVVASPLEAKALKEQLGRDFITVTPGVRPEWAQKADQKRVLTPSQAREEGSDYIVVGRPIVKSSDPLGAAERIIKELKE